MLCSWVFTPTLPLCFYRYSYNHTVIQLGGLVCQKCHLFAVTSAVWVAQTQEKRHDCVTLDLDRYNSPVFKLLSTSSLPLVAGIVFCKPRGSGSEWPLPLGQSLCEPVPSLGWRVSVELVVSLQDVCTEGMEGLYSRNMGSNWHNVVKDPREKFWEG